MRPFRDGTPQSRLNSIDEENFLADAIMRCAVLAESVDEWRKCTPLSDTGTKNENRISKDLPGSVADSEYIGQVFG